MSLRNAILLSVLLACMLLLAGCMGTQPASPVTPAAPAETPASAPVQPTHMETAAMTTPAVTAASSASLVTETPYEGHPYSKTYTFTGTGDYTQEFTTDSSRAWVFRMSCPGAQEIFTADVMDENGDTVADLANAGGGAYTGSATVQLPAGKYYLEVAADSPWTITMSTP